MNPKITAPFILIVTIALFVACVLPNLHMYPLPNPDVFQYIDDGKIYLTGSLPDNIHAPPGNPILTALMTPFLSRFSQFPDVSGALLINVIAISLSFLLFWLIFRQTYSTYIALPFIYILTLPLTYIVALNGTSEALFTFLSLLCFFFAVNHRFRVAFFIAGLTFFVRYEAIAVIGALAVTQLVFQKQLSRHLLLDILCALLSISLMVVILNSQNLGKNLVGNTYLQEVFHGLESLPNWSVLTNLPQYLLPHSATPWLLTIFLSYPIYNLFKQRNSPPNYSLSLFGFFTLFYLIIHLLFPFNLPRYFFPIIWPMAMVLTWFLVPKHNPKNQPWIVQPFLVVIFTFFCVFNTFYFSPILDPQKYFGKEIRVAADWMKEAIVPYNVLTLDPWITSFYARNPQINFIDASQFIKNCINIDCYLKNLPVEFTSKPTYIVIDSDSDFWHKNNPQTKLLFGSSEPWTQHNKLTLFNHVNIGQEWVSILKINTNQ